MRKKSKKTMAVLGTVCMLCIAATACGSESEADFTQEQADGTIQTPETDTTQEDSTQISAADTDTAQEGSTQISATDTNNSGPASSGPEHDGSDGQMENTKTDGRWHVLDPETANAVDADFEGTVRKIDENSFYIYETTTELLDNGFMESVGASSETDVADSDLLQVIYDNNTYFYVRTIYNNGERYEDTDAGPDDLELYGSVSLKGDIEDDIFYADEVRISKVK